MAMSVELGPFFHEHCHPQVPFVGRSDVVARLLQTLRLIAQSNCNPVLITGATGTGKELAAMMVHQWRCGEKRFVGVNCAALTANLLESELFGHVRGAFTGADRDKTGLLEAAEGGSLFLDEVSEMPSDLQAKLLRMLQEKTFRKVGGTTEIACNVTIIASSNRNLLDEVKNGRFRQDLYYRLAVFPVELPALATTGRREDIELLARYFIAISTIAPDRQGVTLGQAALARLLSHDWPGNVRELKNVIERAMILTRNGEIPAASIIIDRPDGQLPAAAPPDSPVEDFSLEIAQRHHLFAPFARPIGSGRLRGGASGHHPAPRCWRRSSDMRSSRPLPAPPRSRPTKFRARADSPRQKIIQQHLYHRGTENTEQNFSKAQKRREQFHMPVRACATVPFVSRPSLLALRPSPLAYRPSNEPSTRPTVTRYAPRLTLYVFPHGTGFALS